MVILPDNVIVEILSFLNVKSLMQLKCVCKSWKTLITCDPMFIKLHLKRSARNGHLALIYDEFNIIRLPLTSLISIKTTPLPANPYFHEPCFRDSFFHQPDAPDPPYWSYLRVVGSCNGLLCLYGSVTSYYHNNNYQEIFLYLWNPATKTLSSKIVFIHVDDDDEINTPSLAGSWKFWFGYDNSTKNYKIVAFHRKVNEVRVLNLGDNDNVWRHIHSFPVVPLDNFSHHPTSHQGINNPGVYVSGTVNWLASPNVSMYNFDWEVININRFVIVSLDLSTETYRQFLPPRPLGDHLVMKEFGFEESWTQFLKAQRKEFHYSGLLPVF
ncbi:F-box protein [Trifolium pratense]|uniref:F-box protein n=1 Tax=Trifolium pratense TaxID=57577 RepID=A0A2K3LV41_TRIPR|nr:F-box protein [Trifolium pratense]